MPEPSAGVPNPAQFWDELIGPFFDMDGVQNLTRLSPTQIISSGIAGDILAVRTSDDEVLFPTFQFGVRGELLPGLRGVVEALHMVELRGWDIAAWLVTPNERYDERRAVDAMWAGESEQVLTYARRDAERLGQ